MRVVLLSKALVVGAYQKKAEELGRLPGMQLTVLVPPFWQEAGRRQLLERAYLSHYDLRVVRMAFNGHFHVHYYPELARVLRDLRPDVVHIDEEPYNLATAHALRCARQAGAKTLFFTWQNLYRRLPLPFRLMEAYSFRNSGYALAGNEEAAVVLRGKGYSGRIAVVPQFGIDPDLYRPTEKNEQGRPFTIGYLGRLVEAKGLLPLLEVVAALDGDWRLVIVGSGPLRDALVARAAAPDLAGRVDFLSTVPAVDVPGLLLEMDAVVLPSLTRRNWKEQFGRILIEAMACQVAVVGSDSGEIPNVIGEAGLVFPEGDLRALREILARLRQDRALRLELGVLGRQRVLERFTQASIAEQTYRVYTELTS